MSKVKQLVLTVNSAAIPQLIEPGGGPEVVFTGDRDYVYRVEVSDDQALLGFEKCGSIGIGFEREVEEGLDLPSSCLTRRIYEHIRCNARGVDSRRCYAAIRIIQGAARDLLRTQVIDALKKAESDQEWGEIMTTWVRRAGYQDFEELTPPPATWEPPATVSAARHKTMTRWAQVQASEAANAIRRGRR